MTDAAKHRSAPGSADRTRVLVIDDDHEDYLLIRSALSEAGGGFTCHWVNSYEAGLAALRQGEHDVCLLDYHLGPRSGLELLEAAIEAGCLVPIVMVTGAGDTKLDTAAMTAGAADYITKHEATGAVLERVIRHALTRAEHLAELRRREDWHRALLEHLSDSVLVFDAEARVRYASPAAQPLMGWLPTELQGQNGFGLIHPDDAAYVEECFAATRARPGVPVHAEYRVRHKNGSYRTLDVIAVNRLDEPAIRGIVATFRDITERHQTQAALREARDTLQTLIDSAPLAIMTLDGEGKVLNWNRTAETMFGWSTGEVLGQLPPFVSLERMDEFRELLGRVNAGESLANIELARRRKDGSDIEMTLYSAPLYGPDGRVQGVLSLAADNTERRSLEAQLAEAQKVEAVGRLAGGIAHDFNNLLTAILAPAELLLETLPPEHDCVADLTDIRDAARRAADLTRQLLAFSRRQVLEPRSVNLSDIVTGMGGMLRRLITEDIELRTCCSDDLGMVRADASQIEQVLVNLAVNARDAMPDGGTLTIATANVELDESTAAHRVHVPPGQYVMLSVTDTGEGMTAATKARLWEPFFTTKPRGRGTGLGLPTVYGIVKQSGGYIWVFSEPGQGADFKIYLPRVDTPAESLAVPPVGPVPRGSEKLLVVEDDEMVRKVTRRTLATNGHDVLVASSGGEALLIAERTDYGFDMLITDVIMPGMSGRELAERMRRVRPDLKVLFLSGYTDDVVVRHGVLEGDVAFLHKPFTPDRLLRKVKEVLAAE